MDRPFKILMADSDHDFAVIAKEYLSSRGYETTICTDGKEAYGSFYETHFDLVVIDVLLPGTSGFELAEDIRKISEDTPIILIGEISNHSEIIEGFRIGADDFIVKPLSIEELALRIEAINKRAYLYDKRRHIFSFGRFTFDSITRFLTFDDTTKKLTNKESDLLFLFCQHINNVVERQYALKKVWQENNYFSSRNMDVYVTKLRRYLKVDPRVKLENVHGVGYKLVVYGDTGANALCTKSVGI
ncbi:MAG: response regulator transcription factor [Candidatus Limimorpha sp.]